MAHGNDHRRPVTSTRWQRFCRRARRHPARRHLPLTVYALITVAMMIGTMHLMYRAITI
jgi:hypothetical protein